MHSADINQEVQSIKAALENWPQTTITGGQLANLIKSVAPQIDIRSIVGRPAGSGALTEFISRELFDVVERIGNQGADTLHRVLGREVKLMEAASSSQIWRTFVSPNSLQHLVLNKSARCLLVRDVPASEGAGEIEVPKASPEEHDRIRSEFVASLSESEAAALSERIGDDLKFATWIAALRDCSSQMMRRWGTYRRKELSKLFNSRIMALNLDEQLQQAILEQIGAAELSAYGSLKRGEPALPKQAERRSNASDLGPEGLSNARRIAHAVVDRLSYDDLRALKLPLGAVLDAIQAKA